MGEGTKSYRLSLKKHKEATLGPLGMNIKETKGILIQKAWKLYSLEELTKA